MKNTLFTEFQKTESALYSQIRNTLSRAGILIRMENLIVPGLPDCIFISNKRTIFIELKVLRGGKITMPKFQYTIAVDMRNHIHPDHHWYFTHEDDGIGYEIIGAYRFTDIAHVLPEYEDHRKAIKMDLRNENPFMVFTKPADIQDWLGYLKGTT